MAQLKRSKLTEQTASPAQKQFIGKIDNIELLGLKVEVVDKEQAKKINSKNFTYEINLKLTFSKEEKSAILISNIKIFKDNKKDFYLGEIESKGEFLIQNFDEVVDKGKSLPKSVASLFAGVLISTTRGFLIMKSKGTILEGGIIPFFDANKFFADKK